MRGNLAIMAACAVAVALSACTVMPTYVPQSVGGAIGYTDEQIAAGRYRVTFAGDVDDTKELVEQYLLRRAAELTVAAGFTHFVVDKGSIEAKTSQHKVYEPADDLLGWPPGLNRRGEARSVSQRSNWQARLLVERSAGETTRYVASSEIVCLRPEEVSRNPNAIAAREILDHRLRPRI